MSNSNGYRSRAYEPWTDERNIELVELLRSGLPEDVIADRIGRSVGAMRVQCRKMIPPGDRIPQDEVVSRLAALVADADFDWRELLREQARRARTLYWDASMCERLRDGWEQARALDELCGEFGASEVEIARQLMRLGVAETTTQVAERLGCDPHGALAGRIRLATDRAAAAVWVLTVDEAHAGTRTEFGDRGPARRHVSVHIDFDTADQTLHEVIHDHVAAGGFITEITASITERTVGDGTIGFNSFLTGGEILPALADIDDIDLVDLDLVDLDDSKPSRPA